MVQVRPFNGGLGKDKFVFSGKTGQDIVYDFKAAEDELYSADIPKIRLTVLGTSTTRMVIVLSNSMPTIV